jgi:hypothetical protein
MFANSFLKSFLLHTARPYSELPQHVVKAGLWIWIRIGSGFSGFMDPDPYWGSGSRIRIQGQENLRNFSGKMHFLVIFEKILPLKKYKIALTTF